MCNQREAETSTREKRLEQTEAESAPGPEEREEGRMSMCVSACIPGALKGIIEKQSPVDRPEEEGNHHLHYFWRSIRSET